MLTEPQQKSRRNEQLSSLRYYYGSVQCVTKKLQCILNHHPLSVTNIYDVFDSDVISKHRVQLFFLERLSSFRGSSLTLIFFTPAGFLFNNGLL